MAFKRATRGAAVVGATITKWQRRIRWIRRAIVVASLISSIVRIRAAKRNGGSSGSGGGGRGGGGAGHPSPTIGPSTPATRSISSQPAAEPAATTTTAVTVTRTVVDPAPVVEPALDGEPVLVGAGETQEWVEGASDAPPGYPVKVNVRSGIYHVPGGSSYERTNPDRWYRSPMAAEADGFRASKSA